MLISKVTMETKREICTGTIFKYLRHCGGHLSFGLSFSRRCTTFLCCSPGLHAASSWFGSCRAWLLRHMDGFSSGPCCRPLCCSFRSCFCCRRCLFWRHFLLNESYTLWWTQTDPNKALHFTFHKDSNFGATSAILVTTRMLVPSTARSVSSIDFFSSDGSRCRKVAPE